MRDFSAATLRRYHDFLRGLAQLTVDAALQQQEFDFVDAIAADYPINVLARLLDVPEGDTPQLVSWGNEIVGATDPDYARVLIDSPEAEQYSHLPFRSPASVEIFEYGRKLAAGRRGGSGEDLVSKLANRIPEDGVPLTATDFDNYFLLLVVAGNETTRQAISHAMKALMDHPDQLAYLRDNPDKGQIAVEELLRMASPVYHFRRTATRDVEMYGQQVKKATRSSCGSRRATATRRSSQPWPRGSWPGYCCIQLQPGPCWPAYMTLPADRPRPATPRRGPGWPASAGRLSRCPPLAARAAGRRV